MVGPTGKEATILSLADDIKSELSDLQTRLNSRFSRNETKDEAATGRPSHANILDDIIDTLQESKEHLLGIMSFINSEVLPKIN